MTRDDAVAIIEDSMNTHVEWIDFYDQGGVLDETEEEIVGDRAHHAQCVARYAAVIRWLENLPDGVG